jgi:tellurite resistance protein TehA-like permease
MLVGAAVFIYLVTGGPMPSELNPDMWAFIGAALLAIGFDLRVAGRKQEALG